MSVQMVVWGARAARKIPRWGKNIVSSVKSRASLNLTQVLHEQVIHRMRNLSNAVQKENWMDGGSNAIEMCTSMRELMGNLTELNPDEIYCCLKGFLPSDTKLETESKVVTVARSEPFRKIDNENFDAHGVKDNTVWSSLMGTYDGNHNWKRVKCFHCGDLYEHSAKFKCTRGDWQKLYRSTLVFPICYMTDAKKRCREIAGFVTFDSKKKKAFGSLPNVFDYQDNTDEYHNKLREHSQFHLGATLADALSVFLEPLRENANTKGERNETMCEKKS